MSIIKPKLIIERTQTRISIDAEVLREIEQYGTYAQFKKLDEFLEESARYILPNGKEFREWRDKAEETRKID